MIYLDHNATTPIAPEVAEAMLPYLRDGVGFANPSSPHQAGREARAALDRARGQVAALLGCTAEEVLFTSGGTESDNLALFGVARARRARGDGDHVITSRIEHPAVLEPCAALEREGFRVTRLPVDAHGRVAPEALEQALDDRTILVSVMHANNEVGTLQPLAELARLAHARGALLHSDAAQSVGKVRVDVAELGVDLLTVAGHKLYGPKGIGALYLKAGVALEPLLRGAGHERGLRPGTENVLAAVGLGAACELAARDLESEAVRQRQLRERLWDGLVGELGASALMRHGDPEHGLPNTLSVGFIGLAAAGLLLQLGDTLAASAGAACHGEGEQISPVLEAMRVPREAARGTLRFSTGRSTNETEIDEALRLTVSAVARMRTGTHGRV